MTENIDDIDWDAGWVLIKRAFPVLDNNIEIPFHCEINDSTIYVIDKLKLTKTIEGLIYKRVEKFCSETIAKQFWDLFISSKDPYEGFRFFYRSVELIYEYYNQFLSVMANLELIRRRNHHNEYILGHDNPKDALKLVLKSSLLSKFPTSKNEIIRQFYQIALSMEDNECVHHSDIYCKACLFEVKSCNCSQYFYETNRKLLELELVEPLVSQVLTSLVYVYIEHHIEKTCKDSFDISHLESLEQWMDNIILNWIKKIYQSDVWSLSKECIKAFDKKLRQYMYETYTKIRINQLFNITIEYPESLPALEDLRACLPKTDLKSYLAKKMQVSMETRLLHPGVSTSDILTAYVAAIRSMKVLDPSGLLLETVTQPVHQYLRSRDDTIRCVVSSLTEEGSNDLAEELVRAEGIQSDENNPSDEETENWESWMPDAVDVDPSKTASSRRTSDIISMLVNVYGSKELFVNEYRTLLGQRLLSQFSNSTEKEIRYLELLKLRFGDSQLHFCDVMLKDIADSKRINQHIKQDPEYNEGEIPLSGMVLSAQFWPAFKEEKLQIPNEVELQMVQFTKAFETLKGNRTLCWKHHLGTVDLEIELPDRVLNLTVSPIQATIIMHFQTKSIWHLDELSHVMKIPPTMLRKKIAYWQSQGLIHESSIDTFQLVEGRESGTNNQAQENYVEEFESESAMASAQDQREEEMQTFWSYIVGMLMNLDTLPLERIHQMLKMFAFQGPTQEHSLQELRQFLDRKVREHQLIYSGGLYRLPA